MYSGNGSLPLDRSGASVAPVSVPQYQENGSGLYARFGKRSLDLVLSLATLPVTLTVIMMCALVLCLKGGKPFYLQKRLGRDGKVFNIIKLRSMVVDAEARLEQYLATDPALREEWDTKQKLKKDPRITSFGRFLRASSLDELPQIFNVILGDMSLVGPRPMMVDQLEKYGNPRSYFAMRPGITGVWQVSGRNETAFAYRNVLDAKYRAAVSLPLDVLLLFKTVGVVVNRTGQ
jgi:lipopolysaccharide/colanic/teichoic acid biosynthesis glycosyltransferase